MNKQVKFTKKEYVDLYNHLVNIFEIVPDIVKHRFLAENNCVLCKNCIEQLVSTQKQVKEDKIKYAQIQKEKEKSSDL